MAMDITSLAGGGKPPEKEKPPAFEYTAQAASFLVSGEGKLIIGEEGLAVTALFEAAEIPYADMTALTLVDYTVTVRTENGDFVFSRMGSWCQPFFDALCDAYNKAVLKALLVGGNPILTAKGEYQYSENSRTAKGSAPIHIYENCVCVLPPDLGARRIPLCFLTGLNQGDHQLTLQLDTDTTYTLGKLGYDMSPFADKLKKQIRSLREKSLAAVKELDLSLNTAQASAIARRMPEGAAISIGELAGIAPSFVTSIEAKICGSRAAESYRTFQELCDPARIYVGFKKNAASGSASEGDESPGSPQGIMSGLSAGGNPMGALGGMLGGASSDESEKPAADPYMLWLIAPSPDGNACAVEFAGDPGDAAATFIYRFYGGFDRFARQLNMALEATCFKREVIRLTDEELLKPEYARYRMAVQRNTALRFVRSCFAGRVIHSGTWRSKLMEMWEAGSQASAEAPTASICTSCGAERLPGVKFCGQCGAKL